MPEQELIDRISRSLNLIIEDELKLTVGCTDPLAIALATASAASVYAGKLGITDLLDSAKELHLELDNNIYKNSYAVGVPGTGMKGIPIAAILGLLIHDTTEGLLIFSDLDKETINQAIELMDKLPVEIKIINTPGNLYAGARIVWKDGSITASAVSEFHDKIIWTETDDIRTPSLSSNLEENDLNEADLQLESLLWICEHINFVSDKVLDKITEALALNMNASKIGLISGQYGVEQEALGRTVTEEEIVGFSGTKDKKVVFKSDNMLIREARTGVSAATYLRMTGAVLPIMACGGSGNHGITFFISMNIGWNMEGILPDRSLFKGSALGILILHMIKKKTGILTPMCGCSVASGLAASAALAWGMGGDPGIMLQAMNLLLGHIGGVICDGAKPACRFKTSLSAQLAIESARMAILGINIPYDEGLSSDSFSNLLKNLQIIHVEGMSNLNSSIVSILQSK